MRKYLFLLIALLFLVSFWGTAAHAQFVNVSGTVIDVNGLHYSNGTIQAQIIPLGISPTINNLPFTGFVSGSLDINGSFSINLADNNIVKPAGTQWQITISGTAGIPPWIGLGTQTFVKIVTITTGGGACVVVGSLPCDISSTLNPAPQLARIFSGPGGGITCSPGPCNANYLALFNNNTTITDSLCAIFNGVLVCATPMDVQNNGYGIEKLNSASGTACGLSVSFDAAGNAITTADGATVGSEGVAVTLQPGTNASGQPVGCGTSGNVFIGQLGSFSLTFDNQTVIRDYVTIGANGQFHDAGATQPTGVQVIGRVTSLNSGSGTNATADIFTGDTVSNDAAKGGKGTLCEVNGVNAPGQDCNFNDTVPAAGSNKINVRWQTDNGNPDTNVSAEIDVAQAAIPGALELNTDLGGTFTAPQVVGFHAHAYTETSLTTKDVICASSSTSYANCKLGVIPRLASAASDTVLSTDRGGWIATSNAGAVAELVPTAASLGGSNFYFNVSSNGGGTATLTFSGGETVTKNAASATPSATLAITSGGWCNITSDTSGTANWYADCGGTAGGGSSAVTLSVPPELLVNGSQSATSSTLNVTKATEAPNLVWASPIAQSTSNIVQSGSIDCQPTPTACSITTTAGLNANDLLIVMSFSVGAAGSAISDTLANSFTDAINTNSNPNVWFVCATNAGSDTITITGGNSNPMVVMYIEVTGNATTSCRDTASSTSAFINDSPGATFNSVTTTSPVSQAAELVFGFWWANSTVPATLNPGAGFVSLQNINASPFFASIMAEVGTTNQGLSGTQTVTSGATGNWNTHYQGLAITFKLNTTGNGIPVFRKLVQADLPGHAGTFAYCTNTFVPAAVSGPTTETVFNFGCQIPAGTIASGSRIGLSAYGISTMAGITDTITLKVKICQVLGCGSGTVVNLGTTGAITPGVTTANEGWHLEDSTIILTPGSSNTSDAQGLAFFSTALGLAQIADLQNSATVAFNDTVLEYVQISVQNSAAGDSAQLRNVIVTAQ